MLAALISYSTLESIVELSVFGDSDDSGGAAGDAVGTGRGFLAFDSYSGAYHPNKDTFR